MQALPLLLWLIAPGLLAPARAAPPQPSVVPEGIAAAGPSVSRRIPLSQPIPGERLTLGWSGGQLLVTDGLGLWRVDPSSGAVSPAALPPAPGPKKKSKKAPPPPPLSPQAVAIGPGGQAAILALDTVWVFDPLTGALRWKAAAGGATRVQWSVDGAGVEAGGNNRHVVWSASSGTPLEAPDTRAALYAYAALSQRLAVHVADRVEIYDTTGAGPLAEGVSASLLALRPDGRRLAAGGEGLWIWDLDGRRQLQAWQRSVRALAFSPDGARIAALTEGEEGVEVFDAETGATRAGAQTPEPARGLVWGADGALWWVGSKALYRLEPREGDLRAALPGQARITALDAREGWLAAGSAAGGVAVWGPDGALVLGDGGPGSVERLVLDLEGKRLAVRQEGDHLLDLQTGARAACAPESLPCAALQAPAPPAAPPPGISAWIQSDALGVPTGEAWVEAAGEQLRLWTADGLQELRWFGEGGSWARWREGRYTWGAMDPPLFERGGTDARVLPPQSQSVLMIDRGAVTLFDGGPPAALSVLITNTGPGPAYSLRVSAEHDALVKVEGRAERARLAPGERLLVPVTVSASPGHTGETTANLSVRSLYGAPELAGIPVRVDPFPVRVAKAKVKGLKVKLSLASGGGPALQKAELWLAAQGPGGTWTVQTSGEAPRVEPVPYGERASAKILSETLDLSAAGALDLEYRLSEKRPQKLQLVVLVPGGTPVALSVPLD